MPNIYNPQDLNKYSYVRNNPLKYTDPTGHMLTDDDGGTPGTVGDGGGDRLGSDRECNTCDGVDPAEGQTSLVSSTPTLTPPSSPSPTPGTPTPSGTPPAIPGPTPTPSGTPAAIPGPTPDPTATGTPMLPQPMSIQWDPLADIPKVPGAGGIIRNLVPNMESNSGWNYIGGSGSGPGGDK